MVNFVRENNGVVVIFLKSPYQLQMDPQVLMAEMTWCVGFTERGSNRGQS